MLKIGILGVGAIGRTIAAALDPKQVDAEFVALSDQDRARAEALSSELLNHPPVVSIDEMIERCDLAVEAASQVTLPEFVPKALARGRDMLIMSMGGLFGHEEWFRQACEKGCRICVPSWGHRRARRDQIRFDWGIESAQLTAASQSPVAALKGSKYAVERNLPLGTTLAFAGLFVAEDGKAKRVTAATTLPEAQARAGRLRAALQQRGVHHDVLKFRGPNFSRTTTFTQYSRQQRALLRRFAKTGLSGDGAEIVDQAFGINAPMLAINTLRTETEQFRTKGFANLLRGMVGTFRNPTSHAPKITWKIEEQDASAISAR